MTPHDPKLIARLSRIEGQVRAARAALATVETAMLKDHLGHCIEGAITSGDVADQRAKAAELIALLEHSR